MYVTCLGCNENCDLETTDNSIFYDNGETYDCCRYCPRGGFYVEVDEEELQKAWNEDHGIDNEEEVEQ